MLNRTCLLIDDSRVVRKIIRRILEDLHFDCIEAEDGSVALERCAAQMPAAIIVDWIMPLMSGIEFVQSVRRMPGGDAPKIIFCTTENEPRQILKALDSGADEYIMKPFDGDIILNKFQLVGLL